MTRSNAPYPHHAWFTRRLAIRPPQLFISVPQRHVAHRLLLTTSGDAEIRCESNGAEFSFHADVGCIGWFPRDLQEHVMSFTAANGYAAYDVSIPAEQIPRGGPGNEDRFPAMPAFRDALIEAGLLRLAAHRDGHQVSEAIGDEIAARSIITRVCAMLGTTGPEWRKDTSVFSPGPMRRIIDLIDANLSREVPLEDLAREFELSPGHFARKFRHSTGLSLQRFLNQRRIGRSCGMLRDGSLSLARIAIDLGFSSQSHFTRLFSGLTGTTPRRFRRLHRHMGE